jgi:hypothetical protein
LKTEKTCLSLEGIFLQTHGYNLGISSRSRGNMLISPEEISKYFKIHPKYILHVGAHQAEEVLDYEKMGWASKGEIHWVPKKS